MYVIFTQEILQLSESELLWCLEAALFTQDEHQDRKELVNIFMCVAHHQKEQIC